MKKLRSICLALVLVVLAGCTPNAQPRDELKRYDASFLTLFDTATTILGYADSQDEFKAQAQAIHDELLVYHQLYDIYNEYEGINNLCTVNANAGAAPVEVDRKIIDLLLFCRDMYDATGGQVNVASGSVLSLWHDARTVALDGGEVELPSREALDEAAAHISFDTVVIDEENSTVFLSDPAQKLDVGAVAKGYAAARAAEHAPKGMLLSVGGNVCATGPKPDGASWVVGIQNPDDTQTYLHTVELGTGSLVTSGDYQRYFMLDGVRYHHIIDLSTGFPAQRWRSVSILCADSGVADALSTALFTLSAEDGTALLERFDAQAMWVDTEGTITYSDGFSDFIRN